MSRDPDVAIRPCPICGGTNMEVTYERPTTVVIVCKDCETSLNVPADAWNVAKSKRDSDPLKPERVREGTPVDLDVKVLRDEGRSPDRFVKIKSASKNFR